MEHGLEQQTRLPDVILELGEFCWERWGERQGVAAQQFSSELGEVGSDLLECAHGLIRVSCDGESLRVGLVGLYAGSCVENSDHYTV